ADDVKQGLARWDAQGLFHYQHALALIAGAHIETYRDTDAALELLSAGWSEVKRHRFMHAAFVRVTLYELRARARIGASRKRRDPMLLGAALADARRLEFERTPLPMGVAQLLRANVAMARGDLERAVDRLRAGIVHMESYGLGPWLLASRVALGELLRGD